MDAATIEETNRIRLSLGMKPLPVPGAGASQQPEQDSASDSEGEAASTLETRQAQAYDNYKSHMDAEAARKRRDEKSAAIRKARETAQRLAVLEGKGLGEAADGGDVSAKAWLMGQKKRQKKIDKARKLEEELAAAEAAAAQAVQYTSKDLAGIKVAHDTSAFLEGDEQILTLKDATIDENEEEGDELENINLRDHEKLTDRLDLKKKQPGYNPNDVEDEEHGILSQYDDEIHGKKTTKFTLDSDGAIAELSDILGQPTQKANKLQNVSLDDIVVGDGPISSDYLAPSEIKVKRPKKKRSKNTRQKQHDEDDIFPLEPAQADSNAMDLDTNDNVVNNKRKATTDAFVDDEDLQASLAIQRKNALKKRKKTRPEDIAKELKAQANEPETGDGTEDGGLVIGEISEFVAALSKRDGEEERKPRRQSPEASLSTNETERPEADGDHPMGDADEVGGNEVPTADSGLEAAGTDDNRLEEEKIVGEGMGTTLALLRERGLIEESRGDSSYQSHRQRQDFLRRKRQLEEELDDKARQQRERDRTNGKLERMSRADREEYARQQNAWRDHQHSRKMTELISSTYKPTVNIKYTDEHGRRLDQKEAFKHLSHQFHGKGSGKGKTEKTLKKIEDEKRREAQSLFDANQGGGMSAATTQQLKKRKEAGVRLG
ncbi:U4/U6.U5 tri-snRNP-associated protein snu66 [Tolypocladium paradoxum]|uniref:U4/U6.U5 tri-snRNP-associated protein snu66 n=1 Tax=Tolypocladium paradoxum TaxID=94208 RepID=A0A2S4KVE1_9HYPO|nr:U4/U6.U5 tri-snRNP-associated protein snu66 [Tolypocladium paradoxum]